MLNKNMNYLNFLSATVLEAVMLMVTCDITEADYWLNYVNKTVITVNSKQKEGVSEGI